MTAATVPYAAAPRRFRTVARVLTDHWYAGKLTMHLPGGREIRLDGKHPGPTAVMTIYDYKFVDRVFAHGLTGFGEGFMAGEWDSPDISAVLLAFSANLDRIAHVLGGNPVIRFGMFLMHRLRANTRKGSRKNIEAHYDLGNDFYELWLDRTMTYSSARYDGGANSLEAAQTEKYAALARQIGLKKGQHVLEIGCGWGGFAEYAAGVIGAKVTGVTLSPAQLDYARARMEKAGLSHLVDFQLLDYRDVTGTYDAIASIEMFEAVGKEYWPAYFRQVHDLLKPGGKAGLQIISIREDIYPHYSTHSDFIQNYIFPGGMLPTETHLNEETKRADLAVTGVERFAEDYGRTLREWRDVFEIRAKQVAKLGFDERFMKMWRFYLAYCEAGFRTGRTDVAQWTLARA